MKNIKFFITCICTVIAFYSQAQLVYDFNKGEFTSGTLKSKVKPLSYNGFATLKIININTFRYKVELQGSTVNYITPIPSELQTIFRLSNENFSDQNLTKALGLAKEAAGSMIQQAEEVKNNIAPVAPAALTNITDRLDKAMKALVKACEEYITIAQKVANIKFTRMRLVNLSAQQWKNAAELEDAVNAIRLSEVQMKKDYELFVSYYAKAYSLYTNASVVADEAEMASVPGAKAVKAAVNKAEEQIEESHDLFYQDNFIKLIEDIIVLQEAFDNPAYFEVKSAPIQITGDYVNFDLKITPAQVNNLMPYEISRTFPVEIPAKGGLKVDFSVGPAISFGSNSKDELYYLENGATDETKILRKRNNNNSISPGIAAMMHFGPRSGTETRLAGMFGVGAGFQNASDLNFSLYAGASLVFGKKERVMLSSGISYLKVERLKTSEYDIDKSYITNAITIDNVTESVFKPSFFISLSYNLTNRLDIK